MLGIADTLNYQKRKLLALNEVKKRQGSSKTYTLPIPDEETYMIHFYKEVIFDKALEMKSILNKFPDTVGEHYNILVLTASTISFGCFWARYFHRCCIDTIIQEMCSIEKEKRQQQQYQQSAIIKPILNKQLRDNIERGLGSRQPENVIESTSSGVAAQGILARESVHKQIQNLQQATVLPSVSSVQSNCLEDEYVNLSNVDLRTTAASASSASSTTTTTFPNTPEPINDPYYKAIFELDGTSTTKEKLQSNNSNTWSLTNSYHYNTGNSTPTRNNNTNRQNHPSPRWVKKLFTNSEQNDVQSNNKNIWDEFLYVDRCLIAD